MSPSTRCATNPACVRAKLDPGTGHLWPSTQAANLARMGQREAVRNGWNAEAVREAVRAALDVCQPAERLF